MSAELDRFILMTHSLPSVHTTLNYNNIRNRSSSHVQSQRQHHIRRYDPSWLSNLNEAEPSIAVPRVKERISSSYQHPLYSIHVA